MLLKMIRLLITCCLVVCVNSQSFGGELPPEIQSIIGREIPGNGNGPFIALGGAGIGELHSNGLRNGWDGNPATRGMPANMQVGFQQDPSLMQRGFIQNGGMIHDMQHGHMMQGILPQNRFDIPMPVEQTNVGGPFVSGMTSRIGFAPGRESFVPLSSVYGGNNILGGYDTGRRLNTKKNVPPKKHINDIKASIKSPKKPLHHPKKPVNHPKKPIIPQKMPITYAKKPVFNPPSPIIYPKKPIIQPRKPVIHPKKPIKPIKPIIHPKGPIIHPKSPIIHQKKPIIHSKKPIIHPKKPIIQPKRSLIYPIRPTIHPKNSIIHPKKPIISPKKSIIHPKKPVYPEKPVAQPMGYGSYGRRRTFGGY